MNSYKINSRKSSAALIPYNTDCDHQRDKLAAELPKLLYLEPREPTESPSPYSTAGRSAKQKDKFYIEWEKTQAGGAEYSSRAGLRPLIFANIPRESLCAGNWEPILGNS